MISTAEKVARAIADADGEDYMEDYVRYDNRAEAAIEAYRATPEPVAPTPTSEDVKQHLLDDIEKGRKPTSEEAEALDAALQRMSAPTPSPDIAGLDRKLRDRAHWNSEAGHNDDAELDLEAAATLHRVAQERDEWKASAFRINKQLADSFGIEHLGWLEKWRARAEAAEARLSSARDEGREEVAEWLHQNGHITLAAAIRGGQGSSAQREALEWMADVTRSGEHALALLAAEDQRNDKIHDLLETIREQIRNDVAPEHRPEGLMTNIQNVVYAMRGRTRLTDDAAITAPLANSAALAVLRAKEGT